MYALKQSMTAEELIKLKEMLVKKLATIEMEGEVFVLSRGTENERVVDERVLNVSHAAFCSYSGERKADCQYSIPVHDIKNIADACVKRIAEFEQQIILLRKTEEIINALVPFDGAPAEKAKAPAKKGKSKLT